MNKETLRMQMLAGIITESEYKTKLNELPSPSKIEGVTVDIDGDYVELSSDSGGYAGFIEDDGTVSFSVVYDDEDFDDENWKYLLGSDHAFVKISNTIPTTVEALGDYVQITVKSEDLKK